MRHPDFIGLAGIAMLAWPFAYASDHAALAKRMAADVQQGLGVVKADDIPCYLPNKFEMVLNLTTAKTLGLTIPPLVLAQADEVIE